MMRSCGCTHVGICDRCGACSQHDTIAVFRVNLKGVRGVFMCGPCIQIEQAESTPGYLDGDA